jgi:hypothetical protein
MDKFLSLHAFIFSVHGPPLIHFEHLKLLSFNCNVVLQNGAKNPTLNLPGVKKTTEFSMARDKKLTKYAPLGSRLYVKAGDIQCVWVKNDQNYGNWIAWQI